MRLRNAPKIKKRTNSIGVEKKICIGMKIGQAIDD